MVIILLSCINYLFHLTSIIWAHNIYNVPKWLFSIIGLFPIEIPIIFRSYLRFFFFLHLYLCILFLEADTYGAGPGCCRVILWPDSSKRSDSCWHERWEPPRAVEHPTFEEEERPDLCGQPETYRANARAVPLLEVPRGLNYFSSYPEGWTLQENSLSLCLAWHQTGYYANKLMSVGYFCCADWAWWGGKRPWILWAKMLYKW